MRRDDRIGRRYAQALFSAAKGYDIVASVEDDLNGIVSLMRSDPGFRDFILAPFNSRDEKVALAEKVFSDRVTSLTMQVLRVMLEKRREDELPAVRSAFIALRREQDGIVHTVITSAEEMVDSDRTALVAKLTTVLGKTIEPSFEIDPRLLGGVRVAYDNYVLDGTVRGALDRLREKLRYDLLKQSN